MRAPARRMALGLLLTLAIASSAGDAAAAPGSWLELGGGSQGRFIWSIKAKSWEGPTGQRSLGAQRPCLLVGVGWRSGALEYHRSTYRECAPARALKRTGPPLLATSSQPSTGAAARVSAVGMIFAPAVRRVRVTFGGGRRETIRLRAFDPARKPSSGLPRFRYAAFVLPGTWCAERIASLAASGRVLWDSGVDEYECGSGGETHFVARERAS